MPLSTVADDARPCRCQEKDGEDGSENRKLVLNSIVAKVSRWRTDTRLHNLT